MLEDWHCGVLGGVGVRVKSKRSDERVCVRCSVRGPLLPSPKRRVAHQLSVLGRVLSSRPQIYTNEQANMVEVSQFV